ncbi:MAG: sodium:calcium antiporter [Candidatus Entotheonella factor]|uniref:Sodium:calcium antiporter n=1 Tax=Entotheonella factor TaxID=1429438 RepID=W4LVD0_ENTF1|nr:MAG: sodium:calcium antiporter [Candidatus Entotheonella factor]
MILLQFVLGLAVMILGAELLVRGAARLATALGLSPLVIGLTVVAYGTGAPELAISVQASLSGQATLSLGNVVGSNTFNVLLILGLSALITPLVVSQQLVRLDVPLMIVASLLLFVFALDGHLAQWEGACLCLGAVGYTVFSIVQSRKESEAIHAQYAEGIKVAQPETKPSWVIQIALIIVGLGCLVWGARWMVAAAVAMAEAFGLSELVIGLTIVAAGTSLPEVATSIAASIRGERDIAVGNVVGSNMFNILAVLGLAGLVAPSAIQIPPAALRFDIPVLIAVAIACLPIFFTGHVIARWEGALFLGYYLAYLLYVLLAATEHRALSIFSHIMLLFVLPLTGITLCV